METEVAMSCRICLTTCSADEVAANDVVSPCACSGTMRHVHRSCMREWFAHVPSEVHRRECSMCKERYVFEVIRARSMAHFFVFLLARASGGTNDVIYWRALLQRVVRGVRSWVLHVALPLWNVGVLRGVFACDAQACTLRVDQLLNESALHEEDRAQSEFHEHCTFWRWLLVYTCMHVALLPTHCLPGAEPLLVGASLLFVALAYHHSFCELAHVYEWPCAYALRLYAPGAVLTVLTCGVVRLLLGCAALTVSWPVVVALAMAMVGALGEAAVAASKAGCEYSTWLRTCWVRQLASFAPRTHARKASRKNTAHFAS